MSNEELVKTIRCGNDKDGYYMLCLYNQNIGLFSIMFNRLQIPKELEEDAKQEYFLWLSDAVMNYKPEMNFLFASYLGECLKGRLIRFTHEQTSCRLSEDRHLKIHTYEKEKQRLSQIINREPTNNELAKFMGISIHELIRIKRDSQNRITASLNEIVGEDDTERIELITDSKDYFEEVDSRLDKESLNNELWRVVLNETKYDKKSIVDYYNGSFKGDKNLLRSDLYKSIRILKTQPGKLKKLSLLSDIDYHRSKSVDSFQRDSSSVVEDLVFFKLEQEDRKQYSEED